MKLTLVTPVLPVTDVLRTQQYYRDVLAFQIDWRDRDLFGGVSSGDVSLFFQKTESPPTGLACVVNTTNADEVFVLYSQLGAKIVDPVATRPWGMREFTVEDLNGHYLRIGHVDETAADYSQFERGDIGV